MKLLKNKKGMDLYETWVEWSGLLILIGAVLLSLVSRNMYVTYLIILASGMIVGRMFYNLRYQPKIIFVIFSIAFLLGFLLGSFIRQLGNPRFIVVIYLVGIYIGHYLHKKGHLW